MGKLIVAGLLLIVLLLVISAFVVMLAWNAVIPYIFGLPTLDLGQAFALQLVVWSLGLSARAHASVSSPNKK